MRETPVSCLPHAPKWGPGPQPGHMPWLEINLPPYSSQASIQSTGQHSTSQGSTSLLKTILDLIEKIPTVEEMIAERDLDCKYLARAAGWGKNSTY